jgi:hypothetical protein
LPLDRHLAADASASQVADAVLAVWLEIDGALHPIIGRRGVAALYNRSLRLSEAGHPWLSEGHLGNLSALDTGTLKATLSRHLPHEAAQAGAAHLQTFQGLLVSLVGPLLTERLLGSVWASAPSDPAAQDSAP